jgi:hypothetical protein
MPILTAPDSSNGSMTAGAAGAAAADAADAERSAV